MDGWTVKFLNLLDDHSRVCLTFRVGRQYKTLALINTIKELLSLYPTPNHLRMDNGPEFIAHAAQAVTFRKLSFLGSHSGGLYQW